MEEVPPPDRGELAVAEETREGELAELLPDQRDVVIGKAEEPASATRAVEVASERRRAAAEGYARMMSGKARFRVVLTMA